MINGEKVYLRAIEREDLAFIHKHRNDSNIHDYFYEYMPLSMAMQEQWYENSLKKLNTDVVYMICDKTTNERLGTVSVYNIDWRSRKCEWGRYFLVGDVRGKGYGRDIELLILDYVFNHLNMNKLYCEVFCYNDKVIEIHKKFGFKQDGLLREHVYRFGKYQDVVLLSMTKNDYLQIYKNGQKND